MSLTRVMLQIQMIFIILPWSIIFFWSLIASGIATAIFSFKPDSIKTKRAILVLSICTVIFTALKAWIDDKKTSNKEDNFRISLATRDSSNRILQDSIKIILLKKTNQITQLQNLTKDTIKSAIEHSYLSSLRVYTEALAKSNLMYIDSLKSVQLSLNYGVLKIAPSRTHSSVYYQIDKSQSASLNIEMISGDGDVFNIRLAYYEFYEGYFSETKSGLHYSIDPPLDHGFINGPSIIRKEDTVTFITSPKPASTVIFVLYGDYSKDMTTKL